VESEGGNGATFFVEVPQEQVSTSGATGGGRRRSPARAA
jgi:hypothetical protein